MVVCVFVCLREKEREREKQKGGKELKEEEVIYK